MLAVAYLAQLLAVRFSSRHSRQTLVSIVEGPPITTGLSVIKC